MSIVLTPFFWDVRLCGLVSRYEDFVGACPLHLQGTIKMEEFAPLKYK
jgi:hypothetical protein